MKRESGRGPRRYGAVAQALHWLVVAGIVLQYTWAWRIDRAVSVRETFALVNQHKSIGMTVLGLAAVRLAWRAFHPPPAPPPGMPGWERRAAGLVHWMLYLLLFAQPLSGWAWSSAAGYGARFYGLLKVPDLVPTDERLADALGAVHATLGVAMLVLVGIHVLAALRHHFLIGDDVLTRMLPRWKR